MTRVRDPGGAPRGATRPTIDPGLLTTSRPPPHRRSAACLLGGQRDKRFAHKPLGVALHVYVGKECRASALLARGSRAALGSPRRRATLALGRACRACALGCLRLPSLSIDRSSERGADGRRAVASGPFGKRRDRSSLRSLRKGPNKRTGPLAPCVKRDGACRQRVVASYLLPCVPASVPLRLQLSLLYLLWRPYSDPIHPI